jgi:electron transfer flavoprotein alpha subunit
MAVLVLADRSGPAVPSPRAPPIAAAGKLGGDVHLLLLGGEARDAAAKLPGIAKVLVASGPAYDHGLAEPAAALMVALAEGYSHLLAPGSAMGKNIMPRVAALLDVQVLSDVAGIEGPDTFRRFIYAGNALSTVRTADPKVAMTVRAASFDPVPAEGGNAAVEDAPAAADPGLSSFVGAEIAKLERPELTAARVVISGGRAMGSADNFKVLEGVADQLGRGHRRQPRRGGCGLRAERHAGRPDRQDRGAGALHGLRHLGAHPAPGRHEGQQGHRRRQQGRGGADLPGGRLRPGRRRLQGDPGARAGLAKK